MYIIVIDQGAISPEDIAKLEALGRVVIQKKPGLEVTTIWLDDKQIVENAFEAKE